MPCLPDHPSQLREGLFLCLCAYVVRPQADNCTFTIDKQGRGGYNISNDYTFYEVTIMDQKLRMETLAIQAGYSPASGEPRQIPIIQSTTFKYATSEDMGKLFDLEASGYFYSRLQNPTCDMVAAKIAAMEGGTAAMLTGSGQAATFMTIFNIAGQGDQWLPALPSTAAASICSMLPCAVWVLILPSWIRIAPRKS